MDAQENNLCLVNMPELVLDKIVSNIHNLSNVAGTCKYLYEIVCGLEKRRRVLYIGVFDASSRLNIDADAVFDSIMNSDRTIKEMEIRVHRSHDSTFDLDKQQLQKITAIMKRFGANVKYLKLDGAVLPINFLLDLLQQATNLKSLTFTSGKVLGSVTEHATMSLQLPRLQKLKITQFSGLLDIVNLIPVGSLKYMHYNDQSSDVLTTILTKQHNIKCLTFFVTRSDSDLTALCVNYLQLETLIFKSCTFNIPNNRMSMDILKRHTNLRELRFKTYDLKLNGNVFQWICKNLKKLEVFEVQRVDGTIEGSGFEMLGELKKLRYFRTSDAQYLFDNGFQSSHFKSDSIEKFEFGLYPEFRCDELLHKMVNSMAHNLPNLTHLKMKFENFSALCFVLGHCTQIIRLSCYISNLIPDQLTDQRLPNIQHLELSHHNKLHNTADETMSQSITSIVRAMPNLTSMLLSTQGFDVNTMNEFTKEIKSLEYLYVNGFELNRESPADDVVVTIRRMTDQLKRYRINFILSDAQENLIFHTIKDILSNAFCVRENDWTQPSFYLYKGEKK